MRVSGWSEANAASWIGGWLGTVAPGSGAGRMASTSSVASLVGSLLTMTMRDVQLSQVSQICTAARSALALFAHLTEPPLTYADRTRRDVLVDRLEGIEEQPRLQHQQRGERLMRSTTVRR